MRLPKKRTRLALLALVLVPCIVIVATAAAPRDRDRDHDRLPDHWERKHRLSTSKNSAKEDPDRDGLRNRREYGLRTNPRRKDTDRDGYSDKAEIRAGTNPRRRDSHPTGVRSPAPGGFPNASNTGVPAGTALTTVNGNVTLSTAGQVFADKEVNGCITVNASNVTIRRVKVACESGWHGINAQSQGLVVEDTEVAMADVSGRTGINSATSANDITIRRVNVHGGENGIWVEYDSLIADSYIHDLMNYDPATDPHTDGVQIPTGASNITINHNTIYGNYVNQNSYGNSAITTGGNTTNITISNNLLAGGGWTVYCNQPGKGTGFKLTDNRFSRIYTSTVGGVGPTAECSDEQRSGNTYFETGKPL